MDTFSRSYMAHNSEGTSTAVIFTNKAEKNPNFEEVIAQNLDFQNIQLG